ncbi:MAG: bifunctional oligoribonuclease/PAP phosphatase NrnA [Bdellovibrionales bacterium]|nr:bifunctional oligoribonuclease/PAP phosphatase NrnA [Bdellovibrionales bacterium]
MLKSLVSHINNAQSVILTTHKQCDGDGLGAQLSVFHALKSIGKKVRVLNVDATPNKYRFLNPDEHIQYFDAHYDSIEPTDLALVFDTNDKRLLMPLYPELEKKCKNILFIDHHPVLKAGPEPTPGSFIDTTAASTGEIAYDIIKALNIPMNRDIARALYTSIAFDTQLFRYVRNSSRSHEICAELLKYESEPSLIHKHLFGNFSAKKLKYLSKVLSEMEFFHNDRLVFLHIHLEDLQKMGLQVDDSRDLVDMMMNVETIEVAVVIREDQPNSFKVSLRSKGTLPVNTLAESLEGGGHVFSAGASVTMKASDLKKRIIDHFHQLL